MRRSVIQAMGASGRDMAGAQPRSGLLLIAKLVALAASVLVLAEAPWRLAGARPNPSDILAFARERKNVENSYKAVAILGSSRVLHGLDPAILKLRLPDLDFYQFAIDAYSALPILENLAGDRSFHGLVLCEFHLTSFMAEYRFREGEGPGLRYLQVLRHRPFVDFISTWVFETAGQHFAVFHGKDMTFDAASFQIARAAIESAIGGPQRSSETGRTQGEPTVPFPSRATAFSGIDFQGPVDPAVIERWARGIRRPKVADPVWLHIPSWVSAIRSRGGDVVFVRMPVSGLVKRAEDEAYPDRDAIVRSLGASGIHTVDFATEPSLREYRCPDGSHLDFDSAESFSDRLATLLRDRHLLAPGPAAAR